MSNKPVFFLGALVGAAIIILAFGSSLFLKNQSVSASPDGAYVIFVRDGKETGLRIPYDGTADFQIPRIILSSDEQKLVYTLWEDAGYTLYLTDPYGSFTKKISRQHVGEGSGNLDRESIAWAKDGRSITYTENAMTCFTHCVEPDDFVPVTYRYTVNIETGVETKTEVRP